MSNIFPSKCIAHRGGGKLFPENTLEAMVFAKSMGFNSVEFDVMLTKDNVCVLMHDDILQRTSPNSEFCGISISELTCNQLQSVDVGSWFDKSIPELSLIRVPLFEDVLKYCQQNEIHMNIEIKPVPGFEEATAEAVAELTKKYFPTSDTPLLPIFSSFSFDCLVIANKVAGHIPRGYLVDQVCEIGEEFENLITKLRSIEAVSLHTNFRCVNAELISKLHKEGLSLMCYTLDDEQVAHRLLSLGLNSFCTDRLDVFRAYTRDN